MGTSASAVSPVPRHRKQFGWVDAHGADADSVPLYMRQRWYDPTLQRFISRDPIGLAGGVNLYTYSTNKPLSKTDSNGLCPPPSELSKKLEELFRKRKRKRLKLYTILKNNRRVIITFEIDLSEMPQGIDDVRLDKWRINPWTGGDDRNRVQLPGIKGVGYFEVDPVTQEEYPVTDFTRLNDQNYRRSENVTKREFDSNLGAIDWEVTGELNFVDSQGNIVGSQPLHLGDYPRQVESQPAPPTPYYGPGRDVRADF